ncbi:effector-associated domain EAD1-containing protein [Streptomyces sp. SAJ15]|uniref:effector-associated domain EAD1-containing protein n=1 Tax=Streptomyces sp. SAJ15 TaxID=2011095 RepID=UPI0011864993|nr:effector-associated domain EAD1-containing protein [Streptomyces sp. SAJ15]TVL92981.1 hypothetical protein CD790_07565 [Streptomyces sp. SAJ15]
MAGADDDTTELTAEEITALARAFGPGPAARSLLRKAGFPADLMPSPVGVTAEEFWYAVAEPLAAGAMAHGRLRVLKAALDRYPYHPLFRAAVDGAAAASPSGTADGAAAGGGGSGASDGAGASGKPAGSGGARGSGAAAPSEGAAAGGPKPIGSVLVAGASPHGRDPLRAAREARAIEAAAARVGFSVHHSPAAAVTDLQRILDLRPEVLHLICHGEDAHLVFEDAFGGAHRVTADSVVRLLRSYRCHAGVRLRGVVLAACHTGPLAAAFTEVARVVIAHHGELDDEAAVAYAAALYGLLDRVPALHDAALVAADQAAAALGDDYGVELRENLVVRGWDAPG